MHIYLYLVALFIMLAIPSAGQSKNEILLQIGRDTKIINNDTGYTKVILKDRDLGTLTGLFKHDTLCKINRLVKDDHGISTLEYFLRNGQLIYIFETYTQIYYEKPGDKSTRKQETNFTASYYFHDNEMIDLMSLGHGRTESDEPFEEQFLKDARDYSALLIKAGNK